MIGGCVNSLATQPLAVNLPTECKQLPVIYPMIRRGEDLGVRSGKYAAALGQCNARIVSGNACHAEQRAIYAGHSD